MSTPNFEKFLEEFNERALRPALLAGKEKLDQTLASVPSSFIVQSVEDLYAQIGQADLASGLSALDTNVIEESVEKLKTQLQKPAVSLLVAHGVKEFLNQNTTEQLQEALLAASADTSPEQLLIAQVVLGQLGPKLDELRATPVEDIAAQIRTGASKLSGADVAAQIKYALETAPELLGQQTPDLTSQLPAPQIVADAVQELGKAASDTLGKASKGATLADTISVLKQFPANANDVLTRVLGGQSGPAAPKAPEAPVVKKPTKKGPKKGGKGFKI